MEQLHTRWRTWFPSVRWPTRWRSPKGDGATASPRPGPVGYLVNHPGGLAGVQGIGYDYVLGSGGLHVQSQGARLTARIPLRPLHGAGPRSRGREGGADPRPHPGASLRAGAALVSGRPRHRAALRRSLGRASLPAGGTPTGRHRHETRVPAPCGGGPEFHSHGGSRAFFSATDDRDEQGFRIYVVVGRLDTPLPELSLRVGVYGHFAPVDWPHVFSGPDPSVVLMTEELTRTPIERKGGD